VNAQTAGGATSLHRAAYAGHNDVTALLCVPSFLSSVLSCLPIQASPCLLHNTLSRKTTISVHEELCCRLENGADVLLQDSDGSTALHKACDRVRHLSFYAISAVVANTVLGDYSHSSAACRATEILHSFCSPKRLRAGMCAIIRDANRC
jgi:ankyrin repeat protein